ncbi:MAG: hypothetical protein IJP52_05810 [Paludibacteraceae bacterium]|nr:hypothetical protein [Paludibacteraceae bacterium]
MRHWILLLSLFVGLTTMAEQQAQTVHIDNPATWVASDLNAYTGRTITFDEPWYVTYVSGASIYVSPRRLFSPTNQVLPGSSEYASMLTLNRNGSVLLKGVSGYHRTGERLHDLTVTVSSTSQLTLQSCTWAGNTREELMQGIDMAAIDARGPHTLLVCGANLQYYLTQQVGFDSGYGPRDDAEHQKQRKKVSKALATINADIYGLVEVEQGPYAQAEIAADLTRLTGRTYKYVSDNTSASGSYTKSCYVYCSETVEPFGTLYSTSTGVKNRKMMQCFRQKENGEKFLYSINHFKAKRGSGTGSDADQGDGQGEYNASRVEEAKAVANLYDRCRTAFNDDNLLIMGDLNAYGMEDPIRTLTQKGMVDLHRYFHADSSYSYVYYGEAGYLDHALCDTSLLPQVTGMTPFHINSDEQDKYSYTSSDTTMFRCSDHDPVVVGLRLSNQAVYTKADMLVVDSKLVIQNVRQGHLRIYSIDGLLVYDKALGSTGAQEQTIDMHSIPALTKGLYVFFLYHDGVTLRKKIFLQ